MKRWLLEKFGGPEVKKLLTALDGHKTELGLVLTALPDIVNQFVGLLTTVTGLASGLHMDGLAAHLTHASGLLLAGAGGIHRVTKIVMELLKDPKPTE